MGKSLGEVEPEAVDVVLLQQELQVALHEGTHQVRLMVEVMEDAIGVGCIHIEIGVVGCSFIVRRIPPHPGKGVGACGVVVDHVEDHCDTSAVTLIDKLLVHPVGAVSLVHGKEEGGVVAPAVVAVELLHRHQLNGIHAERLQVIQLRHRSIDITTFREITQQHLIDHQVVS